MAPTDLPVEVAIGLDDIPECLVLSGESSWNQTEADWALFIRHGSCIGLRAGPRLVASAAALPFGPSFGWISMVLVTEDWRRKGLASRLMNRCIEILRAGGQASMLDASPEGATVYRKLDFKTECDMLRWRGAGAGIPAGGDRGSLSSILAKDREAFGGDRAFLLSDFASRAGTRVIESDAGYVLLRQGRRASQIGPLVADNPEAGTQLLRRALEAAEGAVIVDVLDAGRPLERLLRERGFERFRTFERMVLDRVGLPGRPESLMIAAGPEFG